MAKLRRADTAADEYGFVGTHILDNGKFLSHVRLSVLDERGHMGRLGSLGVQIGRCGGGRSYGGKRPGCGWAWAWKRGTATLREMRCPACGNGLDQTTLALRQPFYVIEPGAVRVIATDTLHGYRDRNYERLEAIQTDTEQPPEWREYRVEQIKVEIEKLTARLRKVQKNPKRRAAACSR